MKLRFATCVVLGLLSQGGQAAPPNSPTNPLPPDLSTGAPSSPSMCARVIDPGALPLDVRFFARDPAELPREDFTIIALPDTQYYAETYPAIFQSQVEWIVENRKALNIQFVTHLGDVVQIAANDFEWEVAEAAMGLLDDPARTELEHGIPFGITIGNHDQSPSNRAGTPLDNGAATTVNFNAYYGVNRFAGRPYYGGHFGVNNDNSYQLFSASGMDFIIFHHEFDDTFVTMLDQVLPWTDQLLKQYRDRRAMLVTHSLLCTATLCPSTLFAEFSTQGQMTYDALKGNENLFLMMCGHAGASYQQPRRTDVYNGNQIHTFLADYQRGEDCPFRCGKGWLRIVTFSPANNEIRVQAYSPWLGEFRNDPCLDGNSCHEFTLPYDMEGGVPFELVGSASSVASGTDICVNWPGRQANQTYEWYVDLDNGAEWTRGPKWTFQAAGGCTNVGQCDDGDPCTADACSGGFCSSQVVPQCCEGPADCDDGNYCTTDSCSANVCSNIDNTNACSDGDDCTAGDICSAGVCAGTALQCDDGNLCTVDQCIEGGCAFDFLPVADCCVGNSDCDDENPCTADSCTGGACANLAVPTCCNVDQDCDDGDTCTADSCNRNEGALYFDGQNDHVSMGSVGFLGKPAGLNFPRFTVECWFRWDGGGELVATSGWGPDANDTGGIDAFPLITKGHVDRDDWDARNVNYFLGLTDQGLLAADFEEHTSAPDRGLNHPVYGSTTVGIDIWHHAAATYDGHCWQLYLDGQPETDGTNCPEVDPAFDTLYQTALATAMDENGILFGRFGGSLDEVRIWDRARSPAEISASWMMQLDRDPHLVARFSLDATIGTTMFDDSENEHLASVFDATLQNAGMTPLLGGICEFRTPGDVGGMSRETYPEDRWAWFDQPGMQYEVIGGWLSDLRADGGVAQASCQAQGLVAPRFEDGLGVPAPGDAHYFVVRAVGNCQDGQYGTSSSGAPRVADLDCP